MTTMLCFQGEMMDSVGGWGLAHHFRHVITDLTLALLQDSGWCGSPSPPPRHTALCHTLLQEPASAYHAACQHYAPCMLPHRIPTTPIAAIVVLVTFSSFKTPASELLAQA